MKAPTRRIGWRITLGMVLLCGVIIAVILIPGRANMWMSNPAVARSSPLYDLMLGPARSPPPSERFNPRSVTVRTNGSEISLQVAQRSVLSPGDRVYGYSLHRADSDQRAAFPDGAVSLSHLGVGYGILPLNQPDGEAVSVPARFFKADLRPVEPGRLDELVPSERERSVNYRGNFPEVRFFFEVEGPAEVKILALQIFDARTHRSLLGGGYSSGASDRKRFWVSTRVQLWHQSPIQVVLSLAHGPAKTNVVEAAVGTTIRHEQGELHLVAVLQQTESSWTSESREGSEMLTLRLGDPVQTSRRALTTFVWYGMPQASPCPLELDYLDEHGVQVMGRGGGSSGSFLLGSASEGAQKVSSVRIRSFPYIRRLIFYLPEIPGLPEENRGVQNLFDVRIPYVRIREDWQLREFLGNVTQLERRFSQTPATAPGLFPLTRTNVLARELAAQYQSGWKGKYHICVSPDGQQLTLEPTGFARLRKQLQTIVQRLF